MTDALVQGLARDLNCLAEENRNTRKRGLEKISAAVLGASPPLEPAVLLELWEGTLRAPVLRLFSDPVEKIREVALTLVGGVLEKLPDVRSTLPSLVPTIAARVGQAPFEEGCEELRLQLTALAQLAVERTGAAAGPHGKELCAIACALTADSFPDVKRAVCALVRALVASLPAVSIGPHCPALARSLNLNLGHQHAKVRSLTLDALCEILPIDDAPLAELSTRLAQLAADHTPAVREQCTRRIGELLARLPRPAAHYVHLLPVLLQLLSDDLEGIRAQALAAIAAAGERAAPAAAADRDGVAFVAPQLGGASEAAAAAACGGAVARAPPFDQPPPWPAVQLVQRELAELLSSALGGLRDWTVGGRLRYASVLLGVLWLARGAATDHLDVLLATLYAAVDDDDAAVRAQVAACARMVGAVCEPATLMALATRHCASDGASAAHRSARLQTLLLLLEGMGADAVGAHAPALAAALCQPHFCAAPVALADEASLAHTRMQLRLVLVVDRLVRTAAHACAREPQAYQLYCTLMQLAAVPTAAGADCAAQRQAMAVLEGALAAACGVADGGGLHRRFGARLVEQLVAGAQIGARARGGGGAESGEGNAAESVREGEASGLIVELSSARAADVRAAAASAPTPSKTWDVSTHDWHVLQALLLLADGHFAAEQLLAVFPVLAELLEPSRDPPLRLTALAVVRRLLSDGSFCTHADFAEWAPLVMSALLVPNLVWRAGRAAQQVRLAAALNLRALLCLEPCPVQPHDVQEAIATALPVLRSALEDESADTRIAICTVLVRVLPWVGATLTADDVRGLYPDLLKRLDDANDEVRLAVCPALEALLMKADYDQHLHKPGSNLDETNLSYLVRGVLVHLDDFSPDIQRGAQRVLRAAIPINPAKLCSEIAAVRDRHRSPKLCDALLVEARSAAAVEV